MPEIGQLFTASEATAYRTLPRALRILAENTLRNGYRDDTLAILERRPAALRLRPNFTARRNGVYRRVRTFTK